MTKVYFGCGIFDLTAEQENELTKIYETPLLQKLKLGQKFPRTALYSRRSALGVGLMKPRTAIAAQSIKQTPFVTSVYMLGTPSSPQPIPALVTPT